MVRHGLVLLLSLAPMARARPGDPLLDFWVYNRDGRHGMSGNATIHAHVSTILADVTRIRRTLTDVYIEANDIPSYAIGPWPGTPPGTMANDQDILVRIPRSPTPAGTPQATGSSAIGVLVNGVVFFNPWSAAPHYSATWHYNAMAKESGTMDGAMGHPAGAVISPGTYHHHCASMSLLDQLGDHGHCHSPLVGFAFDGYPVYGPYAYQDPMDPESPIVRMTSSYKPRTYPLGVRPDGGPVLSSSYPLGWFVEDFEYVPGFGALDEFNGRSCRTPEYPDGTYAYFMTVDAAGDAVYPFIVGPKYYGEPLTDNVGGSVVVPAPATDYDPGSSFPCPQICHPPESRLVNPGAVVQFDVHVRYGAGATFRWTRNGVTLPNGPTPHGSLISGATTDLLQIANVAIADAGSYRVVVTGECGDTVSPPAMLGVVGACYADCNSDGALTVADFGCFQTRFVVGDPYADCNGDGVRTVADFGCFQTKFVLGCP